MKSNFVDYSEERLLNKLLTMYYVEEINQAEIARLLGLSTAKVNRLLKQAKEQGLVEITIRLPSQHLFDLEEQLRGYAGIREAFIVPQVSDVPAAALQSVGRAAADYLLQYLRDGDTICISGGKTMNAIIQQLEPNCRYDVRVVPATGARQGRYYTDVNNIAAQLADKLGGTAYQIHAPVLVDTVEERDAILSVRQITDVLEMARTAQIALFSVGALLPNASYFDLMSQHILGENHQTLLEQSGAVGEVLAYVYDAGGQLCVPQFNDLVIGIGLDELKAIPNTIAVAATQEKIQPIYSALRGGYIKTLITDEQTAQGVIKQYQVNK